MIVHAYIITGERDWGEQSYLDRDRVIAELRAADARAREHGEDRCVKFILGDCKTGADAIALETCRMFGFEHEEVLCDPTIPWPAKGGERNARMVRKALEHRMLKRGPVRFIAFWSGKEKRSGTYNCFQQAVAAGISGEVIARKL